MESTYSDEQLRRQRDINQSQADEHARLALLRLARVLGRQAAREIAQSPPHSSKEKEHE